MTDETLFAAALQFTDKAKRSKYLDRECHGKPELRAQVEELILAHEQANALLDGPTGAAQLELDTACTPASALRVRCPYCHTPLEIQRDTQLDSIRCSSCGNDFSLVSDSGGRGSLAPGSVIGHFQLIEQVGVGGFGAVWKARDFKLERDVAAKIPRKGQFDPQQERSFLSEAQNAAQLSHPGIVPVHEVGRDGDTLFIISEFVEGMTLADRLEDQQPTLREAVEMAAKVADALHHAHERNVVHRDLKPGNIMVDAEQNLYLTDFGLAKREVSDVTVSLAGNVLGTPAYMSPEQARGEGDQADRRSDIYSLGVLLFQLITGELPFRGNLQMMLEQVVSDEPPSPRKLNANVSRDLETITLKCLEKEPARRYATAEEVRAELLRVSRNEPIVARPTSRAERAWRWVSRHRLVSALTTSVAVAMTAGTFVSSYYAIAANKSEQQALASTASAKRSEKLARQREAEATMQLGKTQTALAGAAYLAGNGRLAQRYLELCPAQARDTNWRYLKAYSDESLYRFPKRFIRAVLADPIAPGTFYELSQQHSEIRRLDGRTGKALEVLKLANGLAYASLSHDGRLIALVSRSGNHRVTILQTHPLTKLKHIDVSTDKAPLTGTHAYFSADSRFLVTKAWANADESQVDTSRLDVQTGAVTALADGYSVMGTASKAPLAFGVLEGRLASLSIESGQVAWRGPRLNGRVMKMGMGFNDSMIVVAYADSSMITMHDPADGTILNTIYTNSDSQSLYQFGGDKFAFSKTSPHFATLDRQAGLRVIRLWRLSAEARRPLRTVYCRDAGDRCLDWNESSGLVMAGSNGTSAYPVPHVEATRLPAKCESRTALYLDEEHILARHGHAVALVRESRPSKPLWVSQGHRDVVRSRTRDLCVVAKVDWRSAGQSVVSASLAGPVDFARFPNSVTLDMQVSPGGRYLATAGWYHNLSVQRRTDAGGWEEVLRYGRGSEMSANAGSKTDLFFPESPEPLLLVSRIVDREDNPHREFRMYDLRSGERVWIKTNPVPSAALTLDPAGRVLWTGSADGLVRGYDPLTLELLFEERCHDEDVSAFAFSPDGEHVASGDASGTIRLWKISDGQPAECVREMVATSEPIEALDFNDSGARLLALSGSRLRVWETELHAAE